MTTTDATTPRFDTRRGHPAVRAIAIVALSAALTAGFLMHAWRAPAPSAAGGTEELVHCAPGTTFTTC